MGKNFRDVWKKITIVKQEQYIGAIESPVGGGRLHGVFTATVTSCFSVSV